MKKDQEAETSRRDFLKLGAAAAPAAALTAVAGEAAAVEAEETGSALGLRKTAHVKAYLETARF